MIGVGNEKSQQVYHNKKRKNGKEKKNVVRRGARGGCSVLLFRNLMYHLVEVLSVRHGGYVVEFHSRFSPPQHGGCEERKIYFKIPSLFSLAVHHFSFHEGEAWHQSRHSTNKPAFPFLSIPFSSLPFPSLASCLSICRWVTSVFCLLATTRPLTACLAPRHQKHSPPLNKTSIERCHLPKSPCHYLTTFFFTGPTVCHTHDRYSGCSRQTIAELAAGRLLLFY